MLKAMLLNVLLVLASLAYAQDLTNASSMVIFGDQEDNQAEQISPKDFSLFFQSVKPLKPSALFFLGNLFDASATFDQFEARLQSINKAVKNELGFGVPLYPLLPKMTLEGMKISKQFINFFGLKATLFNEEVVYTLQRGPALFIVLAQSSFSDALMDWLDDFLRRKSAEAEFTFILGQKDLFITAQGIDHVIKARDEQSEKFWKTLVKYHVSAYICNGSKTYDRSLRQEVWFINVGGYFNPISKLNKIPFSQFLLLKIPDNASQNPTVSVIDQEGKQKDFFEISGSKSPIFQLRVSSY